MRRHLDTAIRMTILTAILLGLVYPLAMTGIAQVLFPGAADGSLVKVNGQVVGSTLIAQAFTQDKYFWPRPSAAGKGYDAMASSFSNLGPTNKTLIDRVQSAVQAQVRANPGLKAGAVPVDMVTTSASGLDPDITVANARAQAARVAAARGMSEQQVLQFVERSTTGRTFGFLGEPRVNVLELNMALDKAAPSSQASR
ncbi:MAG TPA: potassium-transporting ATPase subunit KdpC [Thermoleophilia bacterium]|nr:potassium-transporting ATPase subunit KdpC [Thermoleophilia bacterium]